MNITRFHESKIIFTLRREACYEDSNNSVIENMLTKCPTFTARIQWRVTSFCKGIMLPNEHIFLCTKKKEGSNGHITDATDIIHCSFFALPLHLDYLLIRSPSSFQPLQPELHK